MAKKFLVSIDLTGNELLNPVIHNLASDPVSPTPAAGRMYYHTGNNRLMVHMGSSFKQVAFTDELTGSQSLDSLTAWSTAQNLTIGNTLTFNHSATNITLVGASGSTGTASIFNTLSTTGLLFGAATAITVGSTTGTLTLNNPTVVGSQTTVNLWNTASTTVNAFGASTTLNLSTNTSAKTILIGTGGTTGTTSITIGTTGGTSPVLVLNGSVTLGSHATAGFVKTNASGVVSIDTSTYALSTATISGVALGGTLFGLSAGAGLTWSTGTTYTGAAAATLAIDDVAGGTPSAWASVTTGSISIGAGLTTGALNIASSGTGATAITIGHTNSTTTVNGTFKVGASTLVAGTTATLTLPSTTGTLALVSQLPTVNAGTLGAAASTAGSTNTTVETNFSAAWDANSASNVTIKNVVGPAITNLASAMTGAGAGIIRKTAQDTYSIDTGTYALQSYVDNAVAGLSWKDEVRVASTANLAVASAVINGAVVDGVTLSTGDRILLKDQSAPAENGIYIVAVSGAASRSSDADSDTDIRGASVFVTSGTANGGKRFTCSVSGTITLNTTALPFVLFGADVTGNLVNKYSVTFGDGAATSYAITHNLGTLDVTVEVYAVSGGAVVECDVTHTSTTQITLGFVTAPTSNQYRVVVHG